jgi:chaperonin GroEL
VDEYRATLTNDEQKLGADIIKKALPYPLRLIATNAGTNGSVVMQRVIDGQSNANFG